MGGGGLNSLTRAFSTACSHWDTTVKKHTDPSDITVNLCLERSPDLAGSQVLFFGRHDLKGAKPAAPEPLKVLGTAATPSQPPPPPPARFLVSPESGWAMVHWGRHPHLVTSLVRGQRTNVVLTYCFVDPARSAAMKTDCFQDEGLK